MDTYYIQCDCDIEPKYLTSYTFNSGQDPIIIHIDCSEHLRKQDNSDTQSGFYNEGDNNE